MFWNKALVGSNIVQVFLTIDGICYIMDYGFWKSTWKHDKNMFTKTKTNTRKLQNMIET